MFTSASVSLSNTLFAVSKPTFLNSAIIQASISSSNSVNSTSSSDNSFKYPVLKSGESKKEKISFITTYKYKGDGTLPFNLKMQKERAKYFASKDIKLSMNKIVPTIKEVNLEAKKSNKKAQDIVTGKQIGRAHV